jgi:hypothetical protein
MVSSDEIRSALDLLFEPDQIIELRALGERVYSGYFTDRELLIASAEKLDSIPGVYGVYVTIHRVLPALLSRRVNRTIQVGKNDVTTTDNDILERSWFLIDADPIRPSGISSSGTEHELAMQRVCQVAAWLQDYGWEDPVIADSGNGAHLLYRVSLANNEESKVLVKRCLQSIACFWDDNQVSIDRSVFNAARIWKLYGTVSRKGDSTDERPHRTSRVINAPNTVREITVDLIEKVADLYQEEQSPQKQSIGSGIGDLGQWLTNHGLIHSEAPYQGGTLYKLAECPFSSDHKDGAYAIQFTNGAIFAGCHHNSCGSGSQRWQDLRNRFEPKETRNLAIDNLSITSNTSITSITKNANEKNTLLADARRILTSGDPIEHMIQIANEDHIGDKVPLHCMIMSMASRAVLNCNGLHVSITGESGDGKSHVVSTFLKQIPDSLKIADRLSDKALFYTDINHGSVIVLDDMALSDQMSEVLKGITTSFQTGFVYRTVNKNREGQKCEIPARCVWWLLKVEGAGDDQVWNRMLTAWIDDSEEQDRLVLDHYLKQNATPPTVINRREWYISRTMWDEIFPAWVMIPFAEQIRFRHINNRRNPEMLMDLIKSHAALHQHQREIQIVDGTRCIVATEDDFQYAAMLFDLLHSVSGGQQTKLTKKESDLIGMIRSSKWHEFTITDLQKLTGLSNSVIRKLICGYSSHGSNYNGLLEKVPALSFFDRSMADGDYTRKARAYTWDASLYTAWVTGVSVWLDRGIAEDRGKIAEISAT